MNRMTWLAVLALATACTETHTQSQVEFTERGCADCHMGTLMHPEDSFPITTGVHMGIDCADCHMFSKSPGLNVVHAVCTGCHTQADMAPLHTGSAGSGYMWDPVNHDFCIACHPSGNGPATPP